MVHRWYGVCMIYHVAEDRSLDKLKRVQLAAARAIIGLRNKCPRDIALHEADLQLLRLRSKVFYAKYFLNSSVMVANTEPPILLVMGITTMP